MQQMSFGQATTAEGSGLKGRIVIGVPLLIDSAFCAASCMIAFGAVIGRTTPAQTIGLMVAQVSGLMVSGLMVSGLMVIGLMVSGLMVSGLMVSGLMVAQVSQCM